MRKFIANVEERYIWECPYCGELCEDLYEDPDGEKFVCEHCDRESRCEGVER